MNKTQLIEAIAGYTNTSKKEADHFLNAFTDIVADTVANGDKVQVTGFGTFEMRERLARDGVNPATSEKILLPASKSVGFKVGADLKKKMNS